MRVPKITKRAEPTTRLTIDDEIDSLRDGANVFLVDRRRIVAANAPAGYTGGQSYNRVVSTTGSGTWIRSESGGLWSDPDSWQDAVIPSGAAHNANFDALDLAVTNRVILDSARTVNGLLASLKMVGKQVSIEGAQVTTPDIDASNGYLHGIDQVMLPVPPR